MARRRKPRILLVNDNPAELQLAASVLGRDKYNLTLCDDAREALSRIQAKGAPDLVITDIHMPGIDGWEFCRLLRSAEFPQTESTPILVVSATFAGMDVRRLCTEIGADGFLAAPYQPRVLRTSVQKLLSARHLAMPRSILISAASRKRGDELKKAFKAEGYTCAVAATLKDTRKVASRFPADIAVIPDKYAPSTLTEIIRSLRQSNPDTVVVLLCATLRGDALLDLLSDGLDAHIREPVAPDELLAVCEQARRQRAFIRVKELLEERTEALRKREAHMRLMMEQIPAVVWTTDRDLVITSSVGRSRRSLDTAGPQNVGRRLSEVLGTDDPKFLPIAAHHAALKGESSSYEMEWQGVWYRTHIEPLFDDAGEIMGAIGIAEDTTDEKEVEDRYRRLVELLPDAVAIHCGGKLMFANDAAASLLGADSPSALEGTRITRFLHVDSKRAVREKILQSEKENQASTLSEERLVRMDGKPVEVELLTIPFTYEDRPAAQIVIRDISDRKQAEREVAEERNLLRLILDNMPDYIFIKDTQSRFLMANASLPSMLGVDGVDDIIGCTDHDFFPKGLADKYLKDEEHIMRTGEAMINNIEPRVDSTGQRFWSSTSKVPVRDTKGRIVGIVGIARDITARILAEEELSYRNHFEKLITRISTFFINLEGSEIDYGIEHALREITRFTNADRGYLFLANGSDTHLNLSYSWQPDSDESVIPYADSGIAVSDESFLARQILRQKPFQIASAANLPPDAAEESLEFKAAQVRSSAHGPFASRRRSGGDRRIRQYQPRAILVGRVHRSAAFRRRGFCQRTRAQACRGRTHV